MRRMSPITSPKAPSQVQTRSLYIKRSEAFDMLREKSINISENSSPSSSYIPLSITVDRTALSPCIMIPSPASQNSPLKIPFDYNTTTLGGSIDSLVTAIATRLSLRETEHTKLSELIENLWQIFREKEAFLLETRISSSSDGVLEVQDARFGFDDAAFKSSGRQEAIHQLRDTKSEVAEEVEAEQDGIVYIKWVFSTYRVAGIIYR